MSATQDELETGPAGPEARPREVALYDRCFGMQDGEPVLAWRYDQNPHGRPVLLLSGQAQNAVAGYACSPRHALSHGDEASAATIGETGDVMTDPDWRGKGLFSALDHAAMAETARQGWPVVIGLPNRKSEDLFTQKLGWKLVGHIRPFTFVLTTDEGARAERLRAGRKARLMVPWTYWRGTMRRGKLRNRAWGKLNTLAISAFDAAVDEVARDVEKDFSFMVRRDHAYLNWRFLNAPSKLFRAHGVYDAEGKMQGYAVVQLPRRGEPTGYVVDLLARDDVAFAAAMDGALGHLAKAGASVARAWAVEGSWWEGRLRQAGFRAPKREDRKAIIAYVHDPEHPLGKAALEPARWYFTDGDRDDETVG